MTDREYYRLPDLVERWQCTTDDLLHLCAQDQAQLCVDIMATEIHPKYEEVQFFPSLDGELSVEEEMRRTQTQRWLARTTRSMPPGFFEILPSCARAIEAAQGRPFKEQDVLCFRRAQWFYVRFVPGLEVLAKDLCVLQQEVERLDRDVFQLARKADDGKVPEGHSWPWGSYETAYLRKLAAAATEHWLPFKRGENKSAPKNEVVSFWLQQEHRVSVRIADAMATILRADDLPVGPRK